MHEIALSMKISCVYYLMVSQHLNDTQAHRHLRFIVLRMSSYCKCSVTFPHCALGWSAVCDCGIF